MTQQMQLFEDPEASPAATVTGGVPLAVGAADATYWQGHTPDTGIIAAVRAFVARYGRLPALAYPDPGIVLVGPLNEAERGVRCG